MTSDETELSMTLLGRKILLKAPLAGQLLILQRMVSRLRAAEQFAPSAPEVWRLVSELNINTLAVIETLIVSPDDLAWIEQQMLAGKIDVEDLRPALSGGKTPAETPADDTPPKVPAKAARATKARKTLRKAPAKTH